MGYEKCSFQMRENLKEIARMAYGSGWFEGRSGGAGRMGIWSVDGGPSRVIKFNTKLGERLTGDGLADDPRMLESCNRLRQELILIAVSAGLGQDVLRQIRAKLGLAAEGGTEAGKLLDRSDVADVITLIGGDKIWDEALREKDMKTYKSGAQTSFKSLADRSIAVSGNEPGVIRDDGSRLTAKHVRTLLDSAKGVEVDSPLANTVKAGDLEGRRRAVKAIYDAVFDDDFVGEFVKAMTRLDGGYDEQDARTRLETCCRLFSAACMKPDGTVNKLGKRALGDLREACLQEARSGASSAFKDRLAEVDLTFADCFANGGGIIFARPKAIDVFCLSLNKQVERLRAGKLTKPDCREQMSRACKNIAWVLEQGVACCTNESDRYQTLENVASKYLRNGDIREALADRASRADFRDRVDRGKADSNMMTRVAWLARGAEKMATARGEAKTLVDTYHLNDFLPADEALMSSEKDPLSTAETLLEDEVGEAELCRAQFVQCRLAMLKAVTEMLKDGTLTRDSLGNGVLAELLKGSVREGVDNRQMIEKRLKDAAHEVLSNVPTFRSHDLSSEGDFAAETLASMMGRGAIYKSIPDTLRNILSRRLRENISRNGPIANESAIANIFRESRKDFNELKRKMTMMSPGDLRTVAEKGIDLLGVLRADKDLPSSAPVLHLLAVFAREGKEPVTDNLIKQVKVFLEETDISKVFTDRELSGREAELYDYVRVQFAPIHGGIEKAGGKIKSAFDGFLELVGDMATHLTGTDCNQVPDKEMRDKLISSIFSDPVRKRELVGLLAKLVKPGGLEELKNKWLPAAWSVSEMREAVGKLREQVDDLGLNAQNPFAVDPADKILDREFTINVFQQLGNGLVTPERAAAVAKKTLSRLQTRQDLIAVYAERIKDPGSKDEKDLFVDRTMLRILSHLQPKFLDSGEKAEALEKHIRAKLGEAQGLWVAVRSARDALRSQSSSVDEKLKALTDLLLNAFKLIYNVCTTDVKTKELVFGTGAEVGADETSDFCYAAILGFTYGNAEVSDAVNKMASGEELSQRFNAFVSKMESLSNALSSRSPITWANMSENDKYVCRLLTGKGPDGEVKLEDLLGVPNCTGVFKQWQANSFGVNISSKSGNVVKST